MRYGRRKAFYTGSNSSCCQHIQSHYKLYKVRCAEKGLLEHHHALPCTLLKAKQEAKKKGAQQGSIDEMLQHGTSKWQFSRDDVLRAVAEFIVCNNQVSCCSESWVEGTYIVWQSLAVANKPAFRNCLVTMHPNANKADIPSSHTILTFIHNSFIDFLQNLKSRIQVSLFILLNLVV